MPKYYLYFIIVAICTTMIALYFLNPIDFVWMPKCPVKLLLGIDCPGCGVQRAVHALLHGHYKEAIGYNLFLVVAFPYLFIILLSEVLREGKLRQRLRSFVECKWIVNGYIATFVIWFFIRNIFKY